MDVERKSGRTLRVPFPPGALGVPVYLLLVPIAALFVGSWLLGWRLQVVESGSMSPGIPVGSLIISTPIDPGRVRAGTVIVFDAPGTGGQVTHRVTEVMQSEDGVTFRTKGDANERADRKPVPAGDVRGQLEWHVPYLGSVLRLLMWPTGVILLVALPSLALVINEVIGRRHSRSERHCPNCGAAV